MILLCVLMSFQVVSERRGNVVDAKCINLTAAWLREAGKRCDFFEVGSVAVH